jgi:hypothetical protein
MKFTNVQRQSISMIVLAAFVALLCFWATPAPATAMTGSSETTMAQGDGSGPSFIEQEGESKTGIQKEKKFPWLIVGLGAVAVGVALYFLVIKKPKFTLTVTLGANCSGTPAATAKYTKDTAVAYNYTAVEGFYVKVKLDGVDVAASGSVTMDKDHSLDVSAAPLYDIRGTWDVNYHWTGSNSGYIYLTFTGAYTSGTFSSSGGSNGTYTVNGMNVEWTYTNGTKYSGSFTSETYMSGTILSFDNSTGYWTASKTASSPTASTPTSQPAKGEKNDAGERRN